MATQLTGRVFVVADSPGEQTATMTEWLRQSGHEVRAAGTGEPEPGSPGWPDVVVLACHHPAGEPSRWLRRFRAAAAEVHIPVLAVPLSDDTGTRHCTLEAGADACLTAPFGPTDLMAQVASLMRLRRQQDLLRARSRELAATHRTLQSTYEQIEQELELAGQVQSSLLPAALPDLPWARFAVHYKPRGRVGGDFYDVFRLDEHHIGFYVADAMGHGIPASLLTIYLKRGVRAKDIFGHQYRLVPADEVLSRLNHDLLQLGLSDGRFLTMIYGLLDGRNHTLTYARGGHPRPLHVRTNGSARWLSGDGPLLGVFEAEYSCHRAQLAPGDKVVFYTDGLEGSELGKPSRPDSPLIEIAAACSRSPVREFVTRLAEDLANGPSAPDDVTILALEVPAAEDVGR